MRSHSEDTLIALLRKRFPSPEYAFFSHVRNTTGYTRHERTADAIAMGLWPSRGLSLHGFEVKSHRNDWLREKKDPAKAEEIASRCDFWWLVAADEKVVLVEELPERWGLLIPKGKTLKVVREAVKLDQPKDISRGFLAAILRRASDDSPTTAAIAAAVEDARKEEQDRAARAAADMARRVERDENAELERLRAVVDKFEKASGIRITDTWRMGIVGSAVQLIANAGTDVSGSLAEQAKRLIVTAGYLEQAAVALKERRPCPGKWTSEYGHRDHACAKTVGHDDMCWCLCGLVHSGVVSVSDDAEVRL